MTLRNELITLPLIDENMNNVDLTARYILYKVHEELEIRSLENQTTHSNKILNTQTHEWIIKAPTLYYLFNSAICYE